MTTAPITLAEVGAALQAYGADLNADARITRDRKLFATRVVITAGRNPRLRIENAHTGGLVASYPATHGSIERFVESFWFWSKRA